MDTTYVQGYQTYGPRDAGDWPSFVDNEGKAWLTERVRDALVERGAMTLSTLYHVVWRSSSSNGQLPVCLTGVALWDAIYACLHRAVLDVDGESCWRIERPFDEQPKVLAGQVRTITVIGRVWGPDRNGNRHSGGTIVVNGHAVCTLEPAGDTAYLWSAFSWLDEHGYTNRKPQSEHRDSTEDPGAYCRRKDIALHYEAIRVGRRKDLA